MNRIEWEAFVATSDRNGMVPTNAREAHVIRSSFACQSTALSLALRDLWHEVLLALRPGA